MNIYGIDGQPIIRNIKLNANFKHEQEMMKSNFVKIPFRHSMKRNLPIGAYVVVDDIKFVLLDPYSPTQQTDNRFLYEPEFQHPIMWLGKLPFIHRQGDTTSWATTQKKSDWIFTGSPATLANEVARYINWLGSVYPAFATAVGTGWTARVSGNLPALAEFSFNGVDILSGAAEMANVCECEYHFDYEERIFYFGDVAFLRHGDSKPTLKSSHNFGIASVSQSKESYFNCFVVKGGTRNISQESPSGDNVQVTERLSLDESKYPDSIIDIREGNGEPMLIGELLFDDIYPKMQLYLYKPRERKCWLLDSETGEKIETTAEYGEYDAETQKYYKCYSKWYIRLAYQKDGEWHDYTIDPETDLIKDKPLSLVFQPNYDAHDFTSPLTGREFELVYFDKETTEKDSDDISPTGFTAQEGDYRIVFLEGDIILPTTERSGLCPKGYDYPSTENNIITLFNVVVDEVYKEIARNELEDAGLKAIARLKKDLNTYTLPSNPVYFENNHPNFYVGQAVIYDNGQDLNGGTSYRLDTHIRKIVQRLDHPECVEISVGNEQIKGSVSSLREKVESLEGGLIGGLTEAQFEELLQVYGSRHFLSKEFNDVASGVITFLRGAKYGDYRQGEKGAFISGYGDAEFRRLVVRLGAIVRDLIIGNFEEGLTDSGARIDEKGNAEFEKLVTRALATLQSLLVRNDAVFGGSLSSPDFRSGFPSGSGWAMQKVAYENAAGEIEYKYVLECDGANIRGTLRIYEMIISQLLGENDNRIITAMEEVHHYDPETGKVWLNTNGGKFVMPFRVNDCIMVQQYQPGNTYSEGGNGYVTKSYELTISEVGTGGMTDENGNRLDWVKFTNFATMMDGGTPESLIAEFDTFCRVDNLTDPERKGIIELISVGTNAPYMDILYGMKTDPDGALKGRLGNLQGIHHHLFGWLQDFGEYLINAYIVGDVRLRRTGESLDTAVEILKGLLATNMAETIYEITEEDNFLKNANFTEVNTDGSFRYWTVSGDNISFYTLDGEVVVSSVGTLADVESGVKTGSVDGRQVLHVINGSLTQSRSVMKTPGTHKEYDENDGNEQVDTYKTVRDTLYLAIRLRVLKGGTLTIGFPSSTDTQEGAMKGKTQLLERNSDWVTYQWSGTWDGLSDFELRFTGECYISMLSLTDQPLSTFKTEYSTQIRQTARNISLIATKSSQNETNIARLEVTAEQISSTVSQNYTTLDGKIGQNTSKITQTASAIRAEVSTIRDDLDGKITNTSSKIDQTASAIRAEVSSSIDGVNDDITSLEASLNGLRTTVGTKASIDALNALEDYVEEVDEEQAATATRLTQTKNELKGYVAQFNSDGSLKSDAEISLAINNLSTAKIRADRIIFDFTQSTNFTSNGDVVMNINSSGDLWIKGELKGGNFSGNYLMNNDIKFYVSDTKFAQFGSTDDTFSSMLYLRHDGGTALAIGSYGSGARGISIIANANSQAIVSIGPTTFCVGEDEYFQITGRPGFNNTRTYGFFAPTASLRTSSFTLPSSPADGTLLFCHGVSSDLTVTTRSHPIMTSDGRSNIADSNSSHNFNDDSIILMFSSTVNKWILFKAW